MRNFRRIISITTSIGFYLASTTSYAALPPLSLSQMYNYAQAGNVRALRAAVQRGMSIDIVDRNGDTALCYAIKKNDKTAYNALRASGANPRHGCTLNMPKKQYEAFMESYGVAGVDETPRAAYNQFNKGEFVISKTTWIIGGVALAAGIGAAFALGGGGGGGGSNGPDYTPTNDSLGDFTGQSKPDSAPSNYKPVVKKATGGTNLINNEIMSLNNDNTLLDSATNDQVPLTDLIDFNKKMLEYAKYIQVAVKAYENSSVSNLSTINLGDVTAGLVTLGRGSSATNKSLIQINAKNGTLGMIASDFGQAVNDDKILISFAGTKANHQVIGMYADTGAIARNNNKIETVSSNATAGTLIGMQGRIINQESNPSSSTATKLINSAGATINLSNSSSGSTNATNIVGMGSYIDEDFLNGAKLLSRAGFVEITNNGTIRVKSTLIGNATYTSNIRQNTGGIIGIRADANTTATNAIGGVVDVEVEANDETKFSGAHAGMLSVHGGNITNDGTINVKGGTVGYGMIAIRGTGSNSEFDNRKPNLINSGNINMDSKDGFGMISFHGGNLTNTGSITFASAGTGIHSNAGTINNIGDITMNNGGKGITVIKNPAGEGSSNYDTANTRVTNSGNIRINKANDKSYGIYTEYGTLNNNGSVRMENTISSIIGTTYGLYAYDGVVNNNGTVFVNINNVTPVGTAGESYGIYSENANINNSATGNITFALDGTAIYSVTGNVTNNGSITMNNGGKGIVTETGNINNRGVITINRGNSVGIYTNTGTVENTSQINVTADRSFGIVSEASGTGTDAGKAGIIYNGTAANSGTAEINMTGKNVIGISVNGNSRVYNYGKININSDVDGIDNAGIVVNGTTTVDNFGAITLRGNAAYISGNEAIGIEAEKGTINNRGAINISGFYGFGLITHSGIINNYSLITLTNAGYGIIGNAGSSTVNQGTISITGNDVDDISYGMHTTDGTTRNDGTITINDSKSFGIYTTGNDGIGGQGVNNGTINMTKDDSVGLFVDKENSIITNTATGTVNISGNNSYGMVATDGKAYNQGNININGLDSFGIFIEKGLAINSGTINLNRLNGTGIFVKNGSATNSGAINYTNATVTDVYGMIAQSVADADGNADSASIINTQTGTISLRYGVGMLADGAGSSATNSGAITISSGAVNPIKNAGMQALNGATATNNTTGTINSSSVGMVASGTGSKAVNNGIITSVADNAYGMYADAGATVINNGTINMSGKSVYGMYATGVGSKAINNGIINLTALGGMVEGFVNTGMQALDGASIYNDGEINISNSHLATMGLRASGTATNTSYVYNTGKITVSGSICNGGNASSGCMSVISIGTNAQFINGGLTLSEHAINFNDWTSGDGKFLIADGGSFEAPEISGKVYADSSIVKDSFDKSYTNENSFIGNSEGLELESHSFMFEASLVENENGNQDVVMTMKDFDEVVSDKSMSDYLSNSYDDIGQREDISDAGSQNANKIFNALKSANNENGFNRALNNQLGLDFFPSLAHQNLQIIKSLDRQINNSLFANIDPREVSAMVGYDFVKKDQERSGAVQGYEQDANSAYGLVEKRYDNSFSYGAGFSLTKLDSKYNNGSKRDDVMINLLAPLKFRADSYTFVSVPRVGYGWGDYNRRAGSDTYSADTKNYYYGITNEARKDIDLGYFTLEPTAEFNILGSYQAKTKETRQITVDATNNISVEAGLGLYAKKSVEIDEDNKLNVRAGATFYQEFGDYNNAKASMFGLGGNYNMKGYEADKSRGVVSGRLDYTHKSINFYTEASKTIERDNSYDVRAGIEVRF